MRSKILCFILALSLVFSFVAYGEANEIKFTDVNSEYWAYNDVMSGVLNGFFSGYTDGSFKPMGNVTRAEAVTLIQRTTQAERKVYTCSFADVADSHWAYSYIGWATETNIVKGVGDNKFEPDRTVTAKELAMMLLNAQGETVEFDKAFEVACEQGLVMAEDNISEDDILSRDAVAKMIYNYYN